MTKTIHWARLNTKWHLLQQDRWLLNSLHEWKDLMVGALRSYLSDPIPQRLDQLNHELSNRDALCDGELIDDYLIEVGATFTGQINPRSISGITGLSRIALTDDGWRDGMLIEFTATGNGDYPYAAKIGGRDRAFKKHEVLA